MIRTYAREFVAIGRYLRIKGACCRGSFLLVEKTELEKLLNQNAYDTAERKLRFWKTLHWIKADGRHLDYPVLLEGEMKRRINIDLEVLALLERLEKQ